jgi:hypothetical protein
MIFPKIVPIAVLASGIVTLAGCSRLTTLGFDTKEALGSVSLVDRCSDFMHRAFPDSAIEVAGSHVDTNAAAANATVTVQGIRDGVLANSTYARDIAVECRFEAGILTGFRWTAGPIRAANPGSTP